MNFDLVFYQIDHRLVALAMLALLTVAGEIGFRSGSRKCDSQDSYRSLVSGTSQGRRAANLMLGLLIVAVLLVIMDVNRPQRGRIMVGIESLERVSESFMSTSNVRLENEPLKHKPTIEQE